MIKTGRKGGAKMTSDITEQCRGCSGRGCWTMVLSGNARSIICEVCMGFGEVEAGRYSLPDPSSPVFGGDHPPTRTEKSEGDF